MDAVKKIIRIVMGKRQCHGITIILNKRSELALYRREGRSTSNYFGLFHVDLYLHEKKLFLHSHFLYDN